MAPNQEVPSPAASELEAPAAGSLGAPALLRMDAPASSAPAGEGEQPAHASEAEQALPANSAPGPAQGLDLAEYAPARGTITLAATPIGNRGDASPRLMAALALAAALGLVTLPLALAVLSARTVAKNLRKLSCLIKHAVIKLPGRERRGVIDF